MKNLRCIGGPRHGSVIGLSGSTEDVKLIDPADPRSRVSYTERLAHAAAGGAVYFLAPAGMSDIEALRIALGPIPENRRHLEAEVDRLCALLAETEKGAA
ncbi:hypothetical protein [Bradyrhizobium sp. ORS 86]|uniref:hypothetical protein n=1 Tax=Bradyrhizobium sp. ORS 86 TaxID=1685970 RepID=UPI00388D6D57